MDYNSNGKGKYQQLPPDGPDRRGECFGQRDFLPERFRTMTGEISSDAVLFGKGLVQEQRLLPDNSALRLTVARYYKPSGRSIQKPYDEGKENIIPIFINACCMGNFLRKIVYILMKT